MSGPGVVVGFDGSAPSTRALKWAVTEATIRQVRLTICQVRDPAAPMPPTMWDTLARGIELTRRREPGLEVNPELVSGSPATVLLAASANGSPSEHATGFAFEEAYLRDVAVRAVCWSPEPGQLEKVTGHWRRKYPDVTFFASCEAWTPAWTPARALRKLAEAASLVVLGAHGTDDVPGLQLGAVAGELLQNAAYPITIVPRGGSGAESLRRGGRIWRRAGAGGRGWFPGGAGRRALGCGRGPAARLAAARRARRGPVRRGTGGVLRAAGSGPEIG